MDSAIEQPLLPQTPKSRPRRTIVISFFLLLTLVAAAFTLYSYLHPSSPAPVAPYFLYSPRYYCDLTPYSDLCFQSMSATLDAGPTPIFSNSIQIAINQLNATAPAITGNSTGITQCRELVRDSLSRLNDSMSLFRDGYKISWLTFQEMDDVMAGVVAAANLSSGCLSSGVEEVKVGVEIARKCLANSVRLLKLKPTIVSDYYNRWILDREDIYVPSYYHFDYGLMYCVYSVVYLFLGLLYFLLWRGD